MQVSEAMYRYGRELGARVLPIYGGQPIGRQLGALRDGVHVVVATPGRAIDHINRGTLRLDDVQLVVLDEADEMLDMGFAEDIEAILEATPAERQTVLFSATMPPRIGAIAKRHLRDPCASRSSGAASRRRDARSSRSGRTSSPGPHKPAALGRILDVEAPAAALVFCRTRTEVDQLTETLNGRGYRAEALHGGMNQEGRDRVMGRLRNGTAELLIATDVAARGLDVDLLTHVINYDVPSAPEAYVHRIGRVGRAGREGVAITLAEPRELRLLRQHRAAHRAADRRSRRCRPSPTCAPASWRRPPPRCARRWTPTTCTASRRSSTSWPPTATTSATSPGRRSSWPTRRGRRRSTRWRSPSSCRGRPTATGQAAATGRPAPDVGPARRAVPGPGPKTRLFINLGRSDRMRPGDLVGAIANESDLTGRDIGPINITDSFSTVDVPAAAADAVIAAIKQTTIRGKRPTIRRDRDQTLTLRTTVALADPLRPVLVVVGELARERASLTGRAVESRRCRAARPCSRGPAGGCGSSRSSTCAGHRFDRWGIRPVDGLVGVPAAPFLHSGFPHLFANTIPFLVLGAFIALGDVKRFVQVTVIVAAHQRARHVAVRARRARSTSAPAGWCSATSRTSSSVASSPASCCGCSAASSCSLSTAASCGACCRGRASPSPATSSAPSAASSPPGTSTAPSSPSV